MNDFSVAKKKFASYLKKRNPQLTDTDIAAVLGDMARFVKVVQKIYTEPQAQFSIKEKKVGNKIVKQKIVTSDYEQLLKVRDKSKKRESLIELIKKFNKSVTKEKYDR